MRIVRGAARGAVVGLVLGTSARALMRAVAVVADRETHFSLLISSVIVGLFVVSGLGAGAAASSRWRWWWQGLVLVPTSGFLLLTGLSISLGEIDEIRLSGGLTTGPLLLTVAILACLLGTPAGGYLAGRRTARGVPVPQAQPA